MGNYKTLKLDDGELNMLKEILIDKQCEYTLKKQNIEDKEDIFKVDKLHRQNLFCMKLLSIIEYLER